MSWGPLTPEISDVFTVAPEVVYSAIELLGPNSSASFTTNRSDPDIAMDPYSGNPEISEAFTGPALQKDEEENNNRHGLVIAQNWEMRQPCKA
jgi:hypothetical protein